MTPQDPRFHDDDAHDASEYPLASPDVQRDIAAMLRQAAVDDGPKARMPSHVESDIRAALQAEMRSSTTSSSGGDTDTPRTVIPLPGAGRTRKASDAPTAPDAPTPNFAGGPVAPAGEDSPGSVQDAADSTELANGASVHSLADKRNRRRGLWRAPLALGAAAAVALGTVGVWQGTKSSDAPTTASPDIQVTNSQTAYSPSKLTTQAAALETSSHPRITSSAQAQDENLGDLSTKKGVETCVKAIDTALAGNPEKVYADFGTYKNQPAVIVVVINHGKKTVWAVNRTCTKRADVQEGPLPLET